jgi:hypothetical protein
MRKSERSEKNRRDGKRDYRRRLEKSCLIDNKKKPFD